MAIFMASDMQEGQCTHAHADDACAIGERFGIVAASATVRETDIPRPGPGCRRGGQDLEDWP